MTQKRLSLRAWSFMGLLALIWGGSFLSNRVALESVPVMTTVAFRTTGGALALWAAIAALGLPVPKTARAWAAFAVMGVLNNALPFTLIVWGQQHIDSGLAAIINASTAIFAVLLAALVFADERLTAGRALGVVLGFAGVATAIGIGALAEFDLRSMGQLACIGAAISYALAATFGRVALKGIPPVVAAAGMLSGASLVMVPMALLRDGAPALNYGWAGWGALVYLAFVASAFAYLLYYAVLRLAGAGNLSLVTLLVAPVAIVLGAIVYREALHPSAYLGFAILALGLLLIDGRLQPERRNRGAKAAPGKEMS